MERSPALADYVPRASWMVTPSAYDEEEAEARSARLAGAEVRVSQATGSTAQEPATPRSQLLRMTSEEALVIGESTVNVMMWLLPARRGKPHTCVFTYCNLLVLVLLYFWMLDTYAPLSQDVSALTLFVWGGRSDGRIAATAEIWRYITSMMLHTSITHLASNLLTFTFASASLERRYGWWLIAPLYVVSGVGANLFSATWEGCDIVVGASGAILGLCAALLVDVLFAYKSMRLVGARLGFLLIVACNLAAKATKEARRGGSTASGRNPTSNWSHIGGAVTGFACAGMLLPLLTAASSEAPHASPRDSRAAMLRRNGAITLWMLCACVLVFTFCVLPLNMAGFLGSRSSFGSQPKHCACDGWCRCDFGSSSEGGAAAGTPCNMAHLVFGGDASLHAIKG